MKYLIKYFFIILVFNKCLFSQTCYETWFDENIIDEETIYSIEGFINKNDSIKVFINSKEKFRIEFLDKIIIGNNDKISNFSKLTKQLFIEKADKKLNNFIYSFFNINEFENKIKSKSLNYIKFKNRDYGNIEFFFNANCSLIDSLKIKKNKKNIILKEISINSVDSKMNADSLFIFNFDNEEEIFKYDFR